MVAWCFCNFNPKLPDCVKMHVISTAPVFCAPPSCKLSSKCRRTVKWDEVSGKRGFVSVNNLNMDPKLLRADLPDDCNP